eukprot:9475239-Pyramimonas_sp.AAC.1
MDPQFSVVEAEDLFIEAPPSKGWRGFLPTIGLAILAGAFFLCLTRGANATNKQTYLVGALSEVSGL